MSRAAGRSFAAFFPQAPAVVEEKRRLAREKQKSSTAPSESSNGQISYTVEGPSSAGAPPQDQDVSSLTGDGQGEPDEKTSHDETGDMLNGVGSASSRTSTHSSVFSQSSAAAMSTQNGGQGQQADLTPATTHDSSPPDHPNTTPQHQKSSMLGRHVSMSGLEYSPISPRSNRAATPTYQPSPPTPEKTLSALPGPGEHRGKKCVFDPELVDRKDPRRKNALKYKDFNTEVSGLLSSGL